MGDKELLESNSASTSEEEEIEDFDPISSEVKLRLSKNFKKEEEVSTEPTLNMKMKKNEFDFVRASTPNPLTLHENSESSNSLFPPENHEIVKSTELTTSLFGRQQINNSNESKSHFSNSNSLKRSSFRRGSFVPESSGKSMFTTEEEKNTYTKNPEIAHGYTIPRIGSHVEALKSFQLSIMSQEKLKYDMVVNSSHNIDTLDVMDNIHKFEHHIFDDIQNLGSCGIKFNFYLSNWTTTGKNLLNDPPLDFFLKDQFY